MGSRATNNLFVASGGMTVATAALAAPSGDLGSILALPLLILAICVVAALIAPRESRRDVQAIGVFAFALRALVAVILYQWSRANGSGGFVFGDDIAYYELAAGHAGWLRGEGHLPYLPPSWNGAAYLFGTFVYLQSALFAVFGAQLLLMDVVNAFLGSLAIMLLWGVADRVFGSRAAIASALAAGVLPSLVIFEAVNFKDALAALLVAAVFWVGARIDRGWPWNALSLTAVPVYLLISIRFYVALALAGVLPLIAAFRPSGAPRRLAGIGLALVLSTLLAGAVGDRFELPSRPFETLESIRIGLSGGRTGFVTARPSPLASAGSSTASPGGSTALPSVSSPPVAAVPRPPDDAVALNHTLSHFPTGLAHALFAPFPWAVSNVLDLASVPDVLFWYVLLVATAAGLWQARRAWVSFAPLLLFACGMTLLFAMFEGNVGTLYRHRAATVAPVLCVLAGPGLVALVRALRRVSLRRAPTEDPTRS